MARSGRLQSELGIYHVLLRGVNRLFTSEADYEEFTDVLKRYAQGGIDIYAYALLDNRIHLVLRAEEDIGRALKPICTSYARYFNRTHSGGGRLFYDRFKSEPINSEEELLGAAAFVNFISKKKGDGYRFCSLSEEGAKICAAYPGISSEQLADTKLRGMYIEDYDCLSKEEIDGYIYELCGVSAKDFKDLGKREADEAMEKLTEKRWIAKTKLYAALGIKKTQTAAVKKEEPPRTEEKKEENEEKEEKKPSVNRELSVWLL